MTLQKIEDLTEPCTLKNQCMRLALMDAILLPDWEERYFSFDSNWNENTGETMASMRDGTGQHYFIVFSIDGVVGKVCDKINGQSEIMASVIPKCFSSFIDEPAFDIGFSSYFFWRQAVAATWSTSAGSDSNLTLLEPLSYTFDDYHQWVQAYCEKALEKTPLRKVYNTMKVDAALLNQINPDINLNDLQEDLQEIFGMG